MLLPSMLLLICSFISLTTAKDSSTRLTRYLLSRHEPASPPDDSVIIDYESQLIHVVSVDETTQTIKVLLHVTEIWYDASLAWNSGNFGGINETWLPTSSVWIPDIIPFNMLNRVDVLSAVRATVNVKSDGRVSFSYPQIVTFMCRFHISDYPFDCQKCTLEIASWSYSADKLRIRPHTDSTSLLKHFARNDEWALTNLSVDVQLFSHEENVVTEVRFGLSLQRKPLHFITSLLLPSYIICMLSVAGLFSRFSTRKERQERFTLGVTATLTLAVLSLVVTEKVPHTSDEIPILVLYFHMNTLLITFATILTSVCMRISELGKNSYLSKLFDKKHEDWENIADWMDTILCFIFCLCLTIPFIYMCHRCAILSSVRQY